MCDIVYLMPSDKFEKKTEFLSLRVSKTVKEKLETIAEEQDRPLSWVVNNILEGYIKKLEAKKH